MPSTSDPRHKYPRPPFPQEPIPIPGREAEMDPQSDHGEQSYRGHDQLAGKVALITGGDSGIGRAIAIAFAREGADVFFTYLSEDEDAAETARWVEKAGRRAVKLRIDHHDEASCQAVIDAAVSAFGHLDILVNNAAFQKTYERFDQIPGEEFERAYQVNVFATFYLSRAALPHMRPGGSIINSASIQSFDPSRYLTPYSSTKAAIANLTVSMAKWFIDKGVRVNAVAPGPVWTPLIPSTIPPDNVKEFGKSTLFERPAQPAELAPAYVFLASDHASYVTGEIYGVTGGGLQV